MLLTELLKKYNEHRFVRKQWRVNTIMLNKFPNIPKTDLRNENNRIDPECYRI